MEGATSDGSAIGEAVGSEALRRVTSQLILDTPPDTPHGPVSGEPKAGDGDQLEEAPLGLPLFFFEPSLEVVTEALLMLSTKSPPRSPTNSTKEKLVMLLGFHH